MTRTRLRAMPPHQVDDLPATLGLALNATQLAPYNFTYCNLAASDPRFHLFKLL